MAKVCGFDDLFDTTGQFGVYQALFFLLLQYVAVPHNAFRVSGLYMLGGLKPTYTCDDSAYLPGNTTTAGGTPDDVCALISDCANLTTQSIYASMYQEYNWACVDGYVLATITSLIPLASMTGNLVGGHLADWVGRKWVVYAGLLFTLAGSLSASSESVTGTDWRIYVVCMFVFELSLPLTYHPAFALGMETVGKNYRVLQSFSFQWTVVYIVNGFLAYVSGGWRNHIWYASIGSLPVLIIWIFVAESPRWLIQKRRFGQAATALNQIARCNGGGRSAFSGLDMMKVDLGPEDDARRRRTGYNLFHLFYTTRLALYTLSQMTTGISINLVAMVIMMNVDSLAGSPFVNVAYLGLLRLWTPFVVVLLERHSDWFGRRLLFISSQGTVFACFLSIFVLHVTGLWHPGGAAHVASTCLALLGYAVNYGLVYIAYKQFTTELFPTVIRSIALGFFSSASLFGSVLAPQFIYLKHYWPPMPYAACAVLTLASLTLGVCVLPETRGRSLPDVIDVCASDSSVNGDQQGAAAQEKKHFRNDWGKSFEDGVSAPYQPTIIRSATSDPLLENQ